MPLPSYASALVYASFTMKEVCNIMLMKRFVPAFSEMKITVSHCVRCNTATQWRRWIDLVEDGNRQTDRQTDGTVSGHSAAKQTQNCPRNTQRVTDGKLYSRAGNVAINLSKSCTAADDSEWVRAQTSGPVGHSVMIARCSLFVWR